MCEKGQKIILFCIRNSYILRPKLPKTPIFLAKIILYSSYILGKTWLTAWTHDCFSRDVTSVSMCSTSTFTTTSLPFILACWPACLIHVVAFLLRWWNLSNHKKTLCVQYRHYKYVYTAFYIVFFSDYQSLASE